jgi:hypothetical protein
MLAAAPVAAEGVDPTADIDRSLWLAAGGDDRSLPELCKRARSARTLESREAAALALGRFAAGPVDQCLSREGGAGSRAADAVRRGRTSRRVAGLVVFSNNPDAANLTKFTKMKLFERGYIIAPERPASTHVREGHHFPRGHGWVLDVRTVRCEIVKTGAGTRSEFHVVANVFAHPGRQLLPVSGPLRVDGAIEGGASCTLDGGVLRQLGEVLAERFIDSERTFVAARGQL